MARKFSTATVLLVIAMLAGSAMAQGRRGPGRGRGPGPTPGDFRQWSDWWQRNQQDWEQQRKSEEAAQKARKTLEEGYKALKAHDTPAALGAFYDVIELQPDNAQARLGMALARAQKGEYSLAQKEFEAALKLKADERLVNYNIAVTHSRLSLRGRTLVMLNKMINDRKIADETLVNAVRVTLAGMDDKARSALGVLADVNKMLEEKHKQLQDHHKPLERWGVTWMPAESVVEAKKRMSQEPLPEKAPFFMPEDYPLPEKGMKPMKGVNPLKAVVVREAIVWNDPAPVTPADPSDPTKPEAVTQNPVTPADPTIPMSVQTPKASFTHTTNGAAFAVSANLLLTSAKLVRGAERLVLEDADAKTFEATVVACDEQTGLALLKIDGGKLAPLPLGMAASTGPASTAAFAKPTVFGTNLEVLSGELFGATPKLFFRCNTHPRSTGSPLFDAQGKVVGMIIATREDAASQLPVIGVETIRTFAAGKFTIPEAAAKTPDESVLELTVTRKE